MKTYIRIATIAMSWIFVLYLSFEWVTRVFFDQPGDPLVPIAMLLLICIGSAIFQQGAELKSDMQEIKLGIMTFVTQARVQTEYLKSVSDYNDLLIKSEKQKPDLN